MTDGAIALVSLLTGDFWTLSGWLFGLVSLLIAAYEHVEKRRVQKAIEQIKRLTFSKILTKTLLLLLPNMSQFRVQEAIEAESVTQLLEYLTATNAEDQEALLALWTDVGVSIGKAIEGNARGYEASMPDGLAECIAVMFISHFSKDRAREYFSGITRHNDEIREKIARYRIALGKSPSNLVELLSFFDSCSADEVEGTISTYTGNELERVAQLFQNQKWSRRMVARMREFLRVRQVSYNALSSKVLETNPMPKLFVLFKNEGVEPESVDEDISSKRVVQKTLQVLRAEGKADLISSLTSVHFLKNSSAVEDLLKRLPEDKDSNYLVFAAAIDPATVNIRTSDRLEGHPARLYDNLLKFRDYKDFYESMILRLGIRPSEIIEMADLGFLVEPEHVGLTGELRQHSEEIMAEVAQFSGRKISCLTDLRDLDDDDKGFLAKLIAEKCGVPPSNGMAIASQIITESKELYDAIYAPPS